MVKPFADIPMISREPFPQEEMIALYYNDNSDASPIAPLRRSTLKVNLTQSYTTEYVFLSDIFEEKGPIMT